MKFLITICIVTLLLNSADTNAKSSWSDVVSTVIKQMKGKSGDETTRKALEKIFEDGGYLCHKTDDMQDCGTVEIPISIYSDSIDFNIIFSVSDGYIAEEQTMIWDGNLLCYDKGYPYARAAYVSLDISVNYVHTDLRGMERADLDYINEENQRNEIAYKGRNRCFGYILQDDLSIVQTEYINGELKPNDEEFSTILFGQINNEKAYFSIQP